MDPVVPADGVIPLDQLIAGSALPASLPETYQHLDAAVRSPFTTTDAIAGILELDPGICARVLRLANSSLYCCPRRVERVGMAVSIIGTRQLRELVLASSVISLFSGISSNVVDMGSFWRHSIACGLMARGLAAGRREANVEVFFVAGVMHDLGLLLMLQHMPGAMRVALERHRATGMPLFLSEGETIGYDHAQAGAAILERWRLPPTLVDPVACHHRWSPLRQPLISAAVHIADAVVCACRLGSSGEATVSSYAPAAWRELRLDVSVLGELIEAAEEQLDEISGILLGGAHGPG